MSTRFIYARTSTTDQNVKQQADYLLSKYSDAEVYTEQLSGKSTDRPVLNEVLAEVKQGDTIIVLSISRLGRTTSGVIGLVEDMKNKGVHIVVDDLGGIDVTSSMGKLVMTTLAAVAEMQRDEMLDKQRIGIERAKAEGKYKGKQQSPETIKKCKEALRYIEDNKMSKEKAAKAAGVGIATLYRYIKENNRD
ncbi:recombinase family protein [Vibrio algivorus]|uniref:Integrase n=1 Tax=Vibrio algivorus TaxID=1667024 RepID=A0ABQ6ESG4_9VIBR|nr:recombinase family protein [Vibrio algivorus]GLT15515.1 integrase [Vibrio algivorus]